MKTAMGEGISKFGGVWSILTLPISIFVLVQLIVFSPILLTAVLLYRAAVYVAPDVFEAAQPTGFEATKKRIMICVDATSFGGVKWSSKDFMAGEHDRVILVHVVESVEPRTLPTDRLLFDPTTKDDLSDLIPPYMLDFADWLDRQHISYEGRIVKLRAGEGVTECIMREARQSQVDCIVVSASKRTGT